jgi:phage terminase large subunit
VVQVKVIFIVDKLVIKALNSNRKVLFLRKTAASLKDSVYQMVLDSLEKFKIKHLCKINKSTYTIELPNGSIFLFKGLDDGEKAKGIVGLTDIYIDEANQLSFEEFNALDKTLRHATAADQQIYLAYNPVSKVNWVYRYWHASGEQPNTFYMHSTYRDNKFLPQSYIDSIERLKDINPQLYKIEGLGEFCSLDKLIFNNYEIKDFDIQPPHNMKLLCGLDFGYVNDASAFVISFLNEEKKVIYIVDEHYQHAMLNNDIASMITYKGYAKELIIADSAEQKSIEEIKQAGIRRISPAAKGQGSILQGIQKLQQYKIYVSPKCGNIITEFQNYSWKKDKQSGEYTNTPIDDYNHCIDALRYSLQCVNNNKLKTLNKAALGL